MLGYVAIGLPCGILGNTIGLNPLQVALLSILLYSGAGQFMIPNMFLAGSGVAAITASVSLVNTRQMLYAASFAPQCADSPRWLSALANIVAMVVAMAGVYLCKALGLTGPAILIGAVAGVVCAMAFAVAAGKGGSHPTGFPPEGVEGIEGAAGASPSEGAANAGVPAGASEGGEGR